MRIKIALLFPGQGSQYVGMGAGLYSEFRAAKQTFDEADDVLGFDLKKMCFDGDMNTLTRTENAQPAILTFSVAAFRVFMETFAIEPECAVGHSLGEISALTCAGSIAFDDALRIVRKRGMLMQGTVAENTTMMIAVKDIDAEMVKEQCHHFSNNNQVVVISNYNAPSQTVISGHKRAVTQVGKVLEAKGATLKILETSAPFHSPLMEAAAGKLKRELEKYTYHEMNWDIVSNVTALPYESKNKIVENLVSQLTAPVQWSGCMHYLEQRGIHRAVELGPRKVLKNIMKKNTLDIPVYSFDDKTDAKMFEKALKEKFSRFFTGVLTAAVSCRNRSRDNNEYWQGVVKPYEIIEKIQDELDENGTIPTPAQMEQALEMLRSVLKTKKVPIDEQVKRFTRIFDDTGTRDLFPGFQMPMPGK
jgi:[acyl-carrier-protein] S-malonyltransferase